MLGLAIGCSFAFGSGNASGVALGFVAAALAVTIFALWIRSRMKLAAAVSQWFGTKIGWQEMPRMSTSPFDAWCERRNLRPHES